MADIELVVKIDEDNYKKVLDTNNRECEWNNMHRCYEAILNGTPLPKGHGALKDADAICKDIISALGIRNENYLLEAEKAIYKRIKNAITIIEADKAERSDDK